jgi:hypothetical protein
MIIKTCIHRQDGGRGHMKKSPSHPGMYRKRPEKTGIPSSDMKIKKMGFCARTGRRSGRLLLNKER